MDVQTYVGFIKSLGITNTVLSAIEEVREQEDVYSLCSSAREKLLQHKTDLELAIDAFYSGNDFEVKVDDPELSKHAQKGRNKYCVVFNHSGDEMGRIMDDEDFIGVYASSLYEEFIPYLKDPESRFNYWETKEVDGKLLFFTDEPDLAFAVIARYEDRKQEMSSD